MVTKKLPACEFLFTITMLLLTESTLDFLNLKSLFSKDVKTTIKECIKNWNDIVVSAMMPNACPPSLPSCWTPLSSYISPIEPPTPSDKANYEECFRMLPSPKAMDDTAVIIKNKGNDLVVSATVPKACPSSFPCHQTPLSSHVSPIEPPTPSDKANYEEHFRMLSSPKAMDDTAAIVENEDIDMEFFRVPQEAMYGQLNKNSSTSGGSALKRK
ncbi:hypothetical protein J3A83DRAFT_4185084 [Scleroderma citrinum]